MVTISEHVTSRTVNTEAGRPVIAELVFNVSGTAHHAEAYVELYNQSSLQFESLNRQNIQIEPVTQDENNPDGSYWRGTVNYDTRPLPEDKYLVPRFSFDTGGGSQHITQAISTIGVYPPGAPNFKGAIGVEEKDVKGVDITVPNLNVSVTQTFPKEMVTTGYMAHLSLLSGKVNGDFFLGFAPGEVLFLGAAGSDDDATDCEISFKFSMSPNRYFFYIGDIYVESKWGWEYMWVRYIDEVDDANGCVVKVPASVYIEQVYDLADFRALGINV